MQLSRTARDLFAKDPQSDGSEIGVVIHTIGFRKFLKRPLL